YAIVGHITRTAVNLHRTVGHPATHLGSEQLAARGLGRNILAFVTTTSRIDDHGTGSVDLGLAIGQHGLDQLEFGDSLAELLPLHGVVQRIVQHALGHPHADGGYVQTAFVQYLHGCLETHTFSPSDEVGGRHSAAFKHHVAGM